ncbi:MAG: hypothetical protein COS94_08335 [Candidatus Hydrogenedentes bacterium CG07_land_8_20_14_0_80_42_17]|nr:MAG: hypothetical protein COS94_08335 [Candidatus Hydrogenedentes bacterium CG07_land_8_20_14_0_80_42_17]
MHFPICIFQFTIFNLHFPIYNFQFALSNFQFPICTFQFALFKYNNIPDTKTLSFFIFFSLSPVPIQKIAFSLPVSFSSVEERPSRMSFSVVVFHIDLHDSGN